MKRLYLLLLAIPVCGSAQSSGGGYFPQYAQAGVTELTELHMEYTDSLSADTLVKRILYFDREGHLVKAAFPTRYRGYSVPYYTYTYNKAHFLTDIQLHGMMGHGYSSGGPDTLVYRELITYEAFDTVNRVTSKTTFNDYYGSQVVTDYVYNRAGKLEQEIRMHYQAKNVPLNVNISVTDYLYDSDGFLAETRVSDEKGKVYNRDITVYKKNGQQKN